MAEAPYIDWSSAAVRGETLSVEIAGERPQGWKQTFLLTAQLLGGGPAGEVTMKSGEVTVADVRPGSEDELRFFLEGAVLQANADHHPETGEDDDDEQSEQEPSEQRDEPAAAMTERFRSFAGEEQ